MSIRVGDTETVNSSISTDLNQLRANAGNPSFTQIASRVSQLRAARGVGSTGVHAVARSTVYDAFSAQRTRWDADLVVDIVRSLGGSEADALQWRARCASQQVASPRRSATPASTRNEDFAPPRPASTQPTKTLAHAPSHSTVLETPPLRAMLALLAGAVIVNLVGGQTVGLLNLGLFLDTLGTAVIAIALGPWYGVAVAVLTQPLAAAVSGELAGLPYVLVSVSAALVWGYGARSIRLTGTAPRFLVLSAGVGVMCTILAAPITVLMHHGFNEHAASDSMTRILLAAGDQMWAAVTLSNLSASIPDKIIVGFVAYALWAPVSQMLARPRYKRQGTMLFTGMFTPSTVRT